MGWGLGQGACPATAEETEAPREADVLSPRSQLAQAGPATAGCVHSGPSILGAWGLRTPLLLLVLRAKSWCPGPASLCRDNPVASAGCPSSQAQIWPADSVLGPAQRPAVPFLPPPFLPSSPGSGQLGVEDKQPWVQLDRTSLELPILMSKWTEERRMRRGLVLTF